MMVYSVACGFKPCVPAAGVPAASSLTCIVLGSPLSSSCIEKILTLPSALTGSHHRPYHGAERPVTCPKLYVVEQGKPTCSIESAPAASRDGMFGVYDGAPLVTLQLRQRSRKASFRVSQAGSPPSLTSGSTTV